MGVRNYWLIAILSSPLALVAWTGRAGEPLAASRPEIVWHIGSIDPRFGLGRSQVDKQVRRAIQLWESAAGRRLFRFEEGHGMPIHLVFDGRQARVQQRQAAGRRLNELSAEVARRKGQHQSAFAAYSDAEREWRQQTNDHNTALSAYNDRVNTLNSNGGVSDAVRGELDAERSRLEAEGADLRAQFAQVQSLLDRSNSLVDLSNEAVIQYNRAASDYNARFGGGEQKVVGECFHRGEALKVCVYAFESQDELAVVLAHELGHALGVRHVKRQNAIMSEVEKSGSISKRLSLTAEDKRALKDALANR